MFDVTKFEVCPQTGITSFELAWNFGHGKKIDSGSFIDRHDADRYIASSKRAYILILFEKYVNHACILMESGHHDFYRKESKISALDRCKKYNGWFQDKNLEVICKVIMSLQEDLRKILPTPGNPSHSTSESKIMDMIVFCKKELKLTPVTNPKKPVTA